MARIKRQEEAKKFLLDRLAVMARNKTKSAHLTNRSAFLTFNILKSHLRFIVGHKLTGLIKYSIWCYSPGVGENVRTFPDY